MRKPKRMSEADFHKKVRKHFEKHGYYVIKLNPGVNGIPKGFPDLLLILPNRSTFYVELKTDEGELSPMQRVWRRRIGEHSCFIMRPKDLA